MPTLALTRAHRAELNTLTGLASNDLSLIWAKFNTANAVATRDALIEVLPSLTAMYGSAAATLGADWYDEMRQAAGIKGKFASIAAELPDQGRTDALARWAVGPLFQADPDGALALGKVSGGLGRIIANADRQSIMESSVADPRANGWLRVGAGNCDFCAMLIDRGAVYSEATADFASHDHCRCSASPAFEGRSVPVTAYPNPPDVAAQIIEAPTHVGAFTSDELVNALDPNRRRTAVAIKKDLEGTAAGRDLLASVKGFTETRGGVANLRSNIAKLADGTAGGTSKARAEAFLDAMNTYPTKDVPTLFRGFAVKVEDTAKWWDDFEGQFQIGKKFSLNASSFSSSEKKAAEFSRMIGGTKQAGRNHTAVRFVLDGDVHALPVEQLSKFKSEKEWITGGNFEVTGYKAATAKQPYYEVTIRQAKTLEAGRG